MAKDKPIKTKAQAEALREMLALFGLDSGKALGRALGLSAKSSRGCNLLRDLTGLSFKQMLLICDVFDDGYDGLSDSDKCRFQELNNSITFPDGVDRFIESFNRESRKRIIIHAVDNLSEGGLKTLSEVAKALVHSEHYKTVAK